MLEPKRRDEHRGAGIWVFSVGDDHKVSLTSDLGQSAAVQGYHVLPVSALRLPQRGLEHERLFYKNAEVGFFLLLGVLLRSSAF